jgi:glycine/D-amino acid oxidase-like deaminating enzyme
VQEINATHAVLAPAAQVDLPALLAAARRRWLDAGRLSEACVDWRNLPADEPRVIDCTGAAARHGLFAKCGFAVSKGEVLRAALADLADDTILHRGQWILPVPGANAWIGATHEPGCDDTVPTAAAREKLLASAQRLTGQSVMPTAQLAGLRLAAPDRKPVIGFHPREPRLGICSGLGSKGVLYAPWLARQWVEHLRTGAAFDPAVDVARLGW